jgi:hypothetical protein
VALAARYLEYADTERALGGERAANEWFYAAVLANPAADGWVEQYQWVPALKRPLPRLRIGVGLQYSGPRADEVREATKLESKGAASNSTKSWSLVTTSFGKDLQRIITNHAQTQLGPASTTPGDKANASRIRRAAASHASLLDVSPGGPLGPGVYYLAAAREGVLRELARREGVDLLVFVDWREVGKNWSVRITLFDAARNQAVLELPRIDSGQIEKARTDPLTDNPMTAAFRKLSSFLEEQLIQRPLPEGIQPRHVVGRLAVLTASKEEKPLRALAEICYYRERGLIDDTQLLLAFQALIGQQPGSELVLGDAAAREKVLKRWLPPPPERASGSAAVDN